MLSQPQETMELHHPRQTKTVAVTCMAFPNNEVNNFIVGSEEGAVFSGLSILKLKCLLKCQIGNLAARYHSHCMLQLVVMEQRLVLLNSMTDIKAPLLEYQLMLHRVE